MSSPLCPELYQRLVTRFGTVLIANEGESFGSHVYTDPNTGRRCTRFFSGEEYRVNCPKCGDTRFRLHIGHRFAEHACLAHCFNENCYASELVRRQLYQFVFRTRRPVVLPVRTGAAPVPGSVTPVMPGEVTPVAELPPDHPAAEYLRERGFDPAELARLYGVGYCRSASDRFKMAEGRIIVPITSKGELAGWQARFVGERNWKASSQPKYYDMPRLPKRLLLYNLDQARTYPWGVLVEGVTDVWAVGPHAVGLLGKTFSFAQTETLAAAFRDRPLVVMLDGDAQRENEAITRNLAERNPSGIVRVTLPEETDPASYSPDVLADVIRGAADRQGVRLPPLPHSLRPDTTPPRR